MGNDEPAQPRLSAISGSKGLLQPSIPLDGKQIIASIPAIVAGVSALSFFLSVIYNTVYFWILESYAREPFSLYGPRLLSLLTITDYLTSSIGWLPVVLAPMVIVFVSSYVGKKYRKTQAATLQPITKKPTRKISVAILFYIGSILLAYLSSKMTEFYYLLVLPGLIPFFMLDTTRWSLIEQLLFVIVSVVTTSAVSVGLTNAHNDLSKKTASFQIEYKNQSRNAVLMRSFEKGMLLRFPDENRIIFRDWAGHEKLWFVHEPADERSRVCVYFRWGCSKSAPVATPGKATDGYLGGS